MNSEGNSLALLRAAFRSRDKQQRIDTIEFYVLVGLIIATAFGLAII